MFLQRRFLKESGCHYSVHWIQAPLPFYGRKVFIAHGIIIAGNFESYRQKPMHFRN